VSFTITPDKPIRSELQRVARQQLKRARGQLEAPAGSQVHDARRRVKKVRAIVLLLRQAGAHGLRNDARRLRAVGRTLSAMRDAEVVLACFDRVSRAARLDVARATLLVFRRDLARAKAHAVAKANDDRSVARAARQLRAVRRSAADWGVPVIEASDLPGMVKVAYRTARQAMRCAERTGHAADLHEWRKAVKTVWYALRLLEALAPAVRPTIADLDRLETLLGEHHDLSMFRSAIAKAGPADAASARKTLGSAATARQIAIWTEALTLGHLVLASRPREFARSLREKLSDGRSSTRR
jgi:CHAD domain-containing protein